MTKDRLAELRQKTNLSPNDKGDTGTATAPGGRNVSNNAPNNSTGPHPDHASLTMEEIQSLDRLHGIGKFFEQVDELRKLTLELKNDVKNVAKHHVSILSKPIPSEKMKEELDALMSTIKVRSKVVRSKLKDMEKDVKHEEKVTVKGETPASLRIRKTQHAFLLREFIDVMNSYQKDQVDYRDRCKARIKRQLHIAEGKVRKLTDDQIDHMIEEGNFTIFTHGIMVGQGKQRLEDVKARHNDIVKLEKSLKELHSLFLEVAVLIENQGDIVDRIETQVELAKDYTEKARDNLRGAEKLQTKFRKKKFWIMLATLLLLVVIGLIIYFTLPKS